MKRALILFVLLAAVVAIAGCGTKERAGSRAAATKPGKEQAAQSGEQKTAPGEARQVAEEKPSAAEAEKNLTAQEIIARTAKVYSSLKSLEIAGATTESVSVGAESERTSQDIHIYYSRPNKLSYARTVEGHSMKLIADGKSLYIYVPEEKIYRKSPLEEKLARVPGLATPGFNTLNLLDGQDVAALLKNPKLLREEKLGNVETFVLTGILPGSEQPPAVQTLWIGKDDFLIRKNVMKSTIPKAALEKMRPEGAPEVKGPMVLESVVTTRKIVANPQLSAATFTFKPPAGAKELKAPAAAETSPLLGKQAPDFTLETLEGKKTTLSSLRGKVVLVYFFSIELPPEANRLKDLQKLHTELADQGLVVLGVSLDESTEATKKFATDQGVDFSILHIDSEAEARAVMAYGAPQIPNTVVIGKDGTVRSHFIGPRPLEFLRGELKKRGLEKG